MPIRAPRMGSALDRAVAVALSFLILCAALAMPAHGQDPDARWQVSPAQVQAARSMPLFQSNEVLELTLTADFHALKAEDRGDDPPRPRPATLEFQGPAGAVALGIRVEARGNWRRLARNCSFPPLWLDLPRNDRALRGTVFEGQNRLKLYVTCRPGRTDYEQLVYAEYLIYPAYNLLTDASFRARPARVTYVDVNGRDRTFTSNAFLLEHKTQMAARNEAVPLEATQYHPASLGQEEAALMELFNYAIGMTDYSAVHMHNVELIRRTDGVVVPVAYDFDWSGTVNAPYARPDSLLGIGNVRQRVFQGFCRDVDYDALFARFTRRREDMLRVVREFEPLDAQRRARVVRYWEEFFGVAADPRRRARVIRDCQPMPR